MGKSWPENQEDWFPGSSEVGAARSRTCCSVPVQCLELKPRNMWEGHVIQRFGEGLQNDMQRFEVWVAPLKLSMSVCCCCPELSLCSHWIKREETKMASHAAYMLGPQTSSVGRIRIWQHARPWVLKFVQNTKQRTISYYTVFETVLKPLQSNHHFLPEGIPCGRLWNMTTIFGGSFKTDWLAKDIPSKYYTYTDNLSKLNGHFRQLRLLYVNRENYWWGRQAEAVFEVSSCFVKCSDQMKKQVPGDCNELLVGSHAGGTPKSIASWVSIESNSFFHIFPKCWNVLFTLKIRLKSYSYGLILPATKQMK